MTPRIFFPLALTGGLFAFAGTAMAADLGPAAPDPVAPMAPPPAPPPLQATGGAWTGFYGGLQLGYGQLTDETSPEVLGDDVEGGLLGAHAGYLYDFGTIVAGVEVDIEGTRIEDDVSGLAVDRLARAKVRLGYDAGRVLPYVTAGAVQAVTDEDTDLQDTGAFAGLGVEYAVTDRLRVGGEVLQHRFEDFDDSGIDFDATTVSARVSWQF